MAFNGSGTFVRLYNWVQDAANGVLIRADRMDGEMDGFATGLSNCLTRDGQGKPSANIDWNAKKLTNLGVGAGLTDAASLNDIQSGRLTYLTAVAGTNTITGNAVITGPYAAGNQFSFVAAGANTAAVTLNVNTLGAKPILKNAIIPLVAGEIASGALVTVIYDGTNFQLTSPVAQVGPAFSAYLSANQSITNGVPTKVLIDSEDFDTASCFASSRFTPTVAGYYQVSAQISMTASGLTDATVILNKNGVAFERGGQMNATNPTIFSGSYSGLIFMNGSTDYLELYGTVSGTTPTFVGGGGRFTKLAAFLARAA